MPVGLSIGFRLGECFELVRAGSHRIMAKVIWKRVMFYVQHYQLMPKKPLAFEYISVSFVTIRTSLIQ